MLGNNNLIVIYGHGGTYKSSIGLSLLNSFNHTCYINLDGNPHLEVNENIKVIDKVDNINSIKECINTYNAILIDYQVLAGISYDDLKELKEVAKEKDKTLILISTCSIKDELMNNEHYKTLKEIADLMIVTDMNR